MVEFDFYLEAWKYCIANFVEPDRIQRRDWKTWTVNLYE